MSENIMWNYLTRQEEKILLRTVAEVKQLWARRDRAWIDLLIRTGIRVGTLRMLTLEDAQNALNTGYLVLRPEIVKRGVNRATGKKQKKPHPIFLTKKARAAIKELVEIRRELGIPMEPDGFLLVSRKSQVFNGSVPVTVRGLELAFKKWIEKADIKGNITPHGLRHTLGRRIMDESTADDPIGIVQAVLDHKHRSTSGIYAGPTKEQVEQSLRETS